MSVKIKVMSFNLRMNTPKDGINAFPNRKEKILGIIENESPDVIGFQEVTDDMRSWLRDKLNDYVIIGCGRMADLHGESASIAYKKNSFEVLRYEVMWLSPTPDVPGSRYENLGQSRWPRIFTAAYMKHNENSEIILVCNAHTDHLSAEARVKSWEQIVAYLSDFGGKVILTGDFNASPDTDEIKVISQNRVFPLKDTTMAIGGTYHGFGELSGGEKAKIDYIFTNCEYNAAESHAAADPHESGIWYSDHHAAVSSIIL
jgi:endonuclease/exonuclease/phosphatase family metal-dependent hydrolase